MILHDLFETTRIDRERYAAAVSQSVNPIDALEQYESQILTALGQYIKGNIIWRGLPNSNRKPALIVDPTKVERRAANTRNYMNMIVSQLIPSWSSFPPRNRSMICSGTVNTADGYGFPYVVLPFGNPKVGIVPSLDFWDSFQGIDIPDANSSLEYFYRYLTDKELPETFPEFVKALGELNELIFKLQPIETGKFETGKYDYDPSPSYQFGSKIIRAPKFAALVVKTMREKKISIIQALNLILEPEQHGFGWVPLNQFKRTSNEVWISAPALLVDPDTLKQWLIRKGKMANPNAFNDDDELLYSKLVQAGF
jgi:hypothetical protein